MVPFCYLNQSRIFDFSHEPKSQKSQSPKSRSQSKVKSFSHGGRRRRGDTSLLQLFVYLRRNIVSQRSQYLTAVGECCQCAAGVSDRALLFAERFDGQQFAQSVNVELVSFRALDIARTAEQPLCGC